MTGDEKEMIATGNLRVLAEEVFEAGEWRTGRCTIVFAQSTPIASTVLLSE
jgi:hypothetical protein